MFLLLLMAVARRIVLLFRLLGPVARRLLLGPVARRFLLLLRAVPRRFLLPVMLLLIARRFLLLFRLLGLSS